MEFPDPKMLVSLLMINFKKWEEKENGFIPILEFLSKAFKQARKAHSSAFCNERQWRTCRAWRTTIFWEVLTKNIETKTLVKIYTKILILKHWEKLSQFIWKTCDKNFEKNRFWKILKMFKIGENRWIGGYL